MCKFGEVGISEDEYSDTRSAISANHQIARHFFVLYWFLQDSRLSDSE